MTIEELAAYSNIRVGTIRRNLNRIAGVTKEHPEIPDGSRYPYNPRRNKFKDKNSRVLALLDATSKYQYVDENMLHLPSENFQVILRELVDGGLLLLNGNKNPYGANRYDVSMQYEHFKTLNSKEQIEYLAAFIGTACGAFYNQVQ